MTTTRFVAKKFFKAILSRNLAVDWKNVKKLKNGESKFIRHLKIVTLTQPNTVKYVHSPNLSKRNEIYEHFTKKYE